MKVFVNAYLENNLGDDLFFEILKNRYNGNKFYVMSSSIKKEDNVVVYKNKFINKIIRRFELKKLITNKCDLIVSIGGSMYMEQKNDTNRKFFLGKKPYYILGSNFGPYHSETYFNNAHKFFEKAEDVCFRDKYSYNLFADIPVVRYAPDIIFSLDVEKLLYNPIDKTKGRTTDKTIDKAKDNISVNNIEESNYDNAEIKDNKDKNKSQVKRAVFSIISCKNKLDEKYEEKYRQAIIEMTKRLIDNGYKITYMSFCKNENDELAIEEILNKLNENVNQNSAKENNLRDFIETYYYRGNIKEALEVLNNSDIIVGTRFHATILGLLLNKTVIPIIYSDKTKHVLEDLSFKGKTVDIRELENYNIEELFEKENMDYKLNVEKIRKEAELQFKELDKVLKK